MDAEIKGANQRNRLPRKRHDEEDSFCPMDGQPWDVDKTPLNKPPRGNKGLTCRILRIGPLVPKLQRNALFK